MASSPGHSQQPSSTHERITKVLTLQIVALVASGFVIVGYAVADMVAPHKIIRSAQADPAGVNRK